MKRLAMVVLLLLAGCTASPPPERDGIRQVDDLPLYEMTYTGDYNALEGIAETVPPSPFGCSLFAVPGLFARNFDWDANAALVLHTDPPEGHASISIVDISYLGVDRGTDPVTDPEARAKLRKAPLLPFDGMNERGLAVGMAADNSGRAGADPAKPTVGSVRILRLILDNASTVEEALAIMARYNLDFSGGPALHYMFADVSGDSAVIEFIDGQLKVERGTPPWQALTNFRLIGADEATRQADHRYATATAMLRTSATALDWRQAMGVLQAVAQQHTRWSVTYDLRTGSVHVVTGKRWQTVHEFRLRMSPTSSATASR